MEVVDAPMPMARGLRRGRMQWRVGMLVLWVVGVLAISSPSIAQIITYVDNIQTIFQNNCAAVGCHQAGGALNNFLDYNTARGDIREILRRIRIPAGQLQHMPQ